MWLSIPSQGIYKALFPMNLDSRSFTMANTILANRKTWPFKVPSCSPRFYLDSRKLSKSLSMFSICPRPNVSYLG